MNKENNIPLVSIAMATYNGGLYLRQQMETLVMQTYANLEIIVSDDGSTDDTLEILYEYEKKYSFFTVKQNEVPHGIKRNFENALKYCKGKYIAFSDQDDIWMLDKIKKMVDNIGKHALIYHNSLFVDNNGKTLDKTFSTNLRMYQGSDCRAFLLCNTVSGHAILFQNKLLSIALPSPNAHHHDWWLAFIAADNGGIKFLDEALVHYRQHQLSQTDFLKLKDENLDFQKIEQENIVWFEACASKKTTHQRFFKKWVALYKVRNTKIFNRKLFAMALSSMKTIHYMRKKKKINTILHILKSSWGEGIRTKFRFTKMKIMIDKPKKNAKSK